MPLGAYRINSLGKYKAPSGPVIQQFSIYGFGSNASGELGVGDSNQTTSPKLVGSNTNWIALAQGNNFSLFLNNLGELYAAGTNLNGATGQGTTSGIITSPTRIGTASNWSVISAGNSYALAINEDGEIYGWGTNGNGQLGLGDTTQRNTPTRIGSASNWIAISANDGHSLFVNSSGELYAVGRNGNGQLGLGDTTQRTTITRVGTASNWLDVAGGDNYSLGIKSNGEIYGWGRNSSGRTGLGTTIGNATTPTRIGSASNWISITSTGVHSLAINNSGELWTWGANFAGQLGLGDTTQRTTPTRVGSSSNWVIVDAGSSHTLAINESGELYAWGLNTSGQLGLGNTNSPVTSPTRVGSATGWNSVDAGFNNTLAGKS